MFECSLYLFLPVKTPWPPLLPRLEESLHRPPFLLLDRQQPLQIVGRKMALDPLAHEVTGHGRRNRVELDARITTTRIRTPRRSVVFVGRQCRKRADSGPPRWPREGSESALKRPFRPATAGQSDVRGPLAFAITRRSRAPLRQAPRSSHGIAETAACRDLRRSRRKRKPDRSQRRRIFSPRQSCLWVPSR